MADITIKQLASTVGAIGVLLGAVFAIDARYAKTDEVQVGHELTEKTVMLYVAAGLWSDLVGREAMYRARSDAGTLNDPDRWKEVQVLVANKRAEMDNLNTQIQELLR